MIYCQALGPIQVTIDGVPAPNDLLWSRNIGLLLYLARAPARRCTRERAIGLFWPDKAQGAARQSLRQALSTLRGALGDMLRTSGGQLELAADGFEIDTDRFDARVAAGDWGGAAALVRGKFADGFVVPNASAFEDWLMVEQGHWARRSMEALLTHAEARLDAGDLLGADEPARRALQLDPLSQRALRTVMRRLAIAGDDAGALAFYDAFLARAKQEGVERPDPETEALAERIRSGREKHLPPDATALERSVEWRRAPLVARERELAEILACWRDARSGHAALAIIEAPAGSGKTRLVEEIMARVVLDGGVAVATRAVPADQGQALAAVVGLARGGLVDAPGVAAALPAALAALGRESSEWQERFPAARTAPPQSDLVAALSEILRAASAEQALLLVFDDAQWLDPASLAALETLLRNLARAPLLVLVAATEPEPPTLAELRSRLGRDLRGVSVQLEAFDVQAIESLVRWALPTYTPEQAERLSRRLMADSAGNPLLVVEICYALAQGLDLRVTNGAWPRPLGTLDDTMPGDLPDTIVAAIRVGFNCLSADARAALAAVAVLGERVTGKRVGAATRLAGAALDAALDDLEWRRWLVTERRGYSFRARIVRDVVKRDMIPPGQVQRILDPD